MLISCRNELRITFTLRVILLRNVDDYDKIVLVINLSENVLLKYSEQLAIEIELLCKEIKVNSNAIFQLRKSSSSVFANITEAQYPQSLPDMLSKFKIARKECNETEAWLKLLFSTNVIDENIFKKYRNLCGRIKRILTASCITIENKLK